MKVKLIRKRPAELCHTRTFYFANVHGFTWPPAWVPWFFFFILDYAQTQYTFHHQPYMAIFHRTAGPQQFWHLKKSWLKLPASSSSMDEHQTCWTSAVLWVVLSPLGLNVDKTADLWQFYGWFGPRLNIENNQTAGPQQFYGWFWAHRKKLQENCWTSSVLWMVWALRNQFCQNFRPWQFNGWVWTGTRGLKFCMQEVFDHAPT